MGAVAEHKLILTDLEVNSNKFWNVQLNDDCSVTTVYGRVGEKGQSTTKRFGSMDQAEKFLNTKMREKERKGYSKQRILGAAPVQVNAAEMIQADAADPTTKKLIDYLVKVNVHQITASTTIKFDVGTGTFSTPLGVVTPDGIDEAEVILSKMGKFVERHDWSDPVFVHLINDYMRIIPSDIGRGRPNPQVLYPSLSAIQSQQQILDSLRASVAALSTAPKSTAAAEFRAKLKLITDDGGEGSATFKRVLKLYRDSKNDRHQAASLRLRRVYEIEILGMNAAFANDGAKMSNIWELWHGTKAANLLSILNHGYVVPRQGGSIAVTGRMFGDGVYFSDQSTKSLNYASGYWSGTREDHCFMLLNDVAMGKYYTPNGPFSGGCKKGYDSTYAKAGRSGVQNNEMIVYRTGQIRPKYLCEFSR